MILAPCQYRQATLDYKMGGLSKRRLTEVFSDGRVISHLLFPYFGARFRNLQSFCSKSGAYRYRDGFGNILQLRTIGSQGQTNPHKQNGIKRRYDGDEHRRMLSEITHFLFVYVGDMPTLHFAVLPKFVIESQSGVPRKSISADDAMLYITNAATFKED